MKKYTLFIFAFIINTISAQYITLSKAEKTNDNKDKFLYKINPSNTPAEYLGEIEVQGFSQNDAEVFSQIYKKAKTIGANSFSIKQTENLDGLYAFNPDHYYINLYYAPVIPKRENTVYILTSSSRPQKIKFNNQTIKLQPRTFLKQQLQDKVSISTGKLLGSKIILSPKKNQLEQYFQIIPTGVRADHLGQGGLNLKSGDIILLEKSYAQFLTSIYKEHK